MIIIKKKCNSTTVHGSHFQIENTGRLRFLEQEAQNHESTVKLYSVSFDTSNEYTLLRGAICFLVLKSVVDVGVL